MSTLMRRTLHRPLLLIAVTACIGQARSQAVAINPDGTAPHASSMLDVNNAVTPTTVRGLLIPRMTQAERAAIAVTAADDGLWVYQANDVAGQPHGLYYYNHGVGWLRWSDGGAGWRMDGNSTTGTEYLGTNGTTGNRNLLLRASSTTGNADLLIGDGVTGNGRVSLGGTTGAPAPTERLDVNGAVRMGFTSTTANAGTIIYGTLAATQAGFSGDTRKFHYGFDGVRWRRFENAERVVDIPMPSYAAAHDSCMGQTGQVLSAEPTGTGNNAVGHTLFPTNFQNLATVPNGYRIQYIYRASELLAAGLCTGPITAIGFNLLDPDSTGNPPTIQPTTVSLRVRLYKAVGVTTFTPTGPFHALARTAPVNYAIDNMVYGQGWVEFPIPPAPALPLPAPQPFDYTAGQDLIVDITWMRNTTQGKSPRTENQTAGLPFTVGNNCVKWSRPFLNPTHLNSNSADHTGPDQFNNFNGITNNAHNTSRPILLIKGNVQTISYVPANAPYTLYEGALMLGDSTWAATNYRGPGVIRAKNGAYDGSTLLSDHIFDRYFDGAVRPEDEAAAAGVAWVGLPDLKEHLATHRHLPNMPSREEWERTGGKSLGELQTGLWQTAEMQALYIAELERDLRALETAVIGSDHSPETIRRQLQEVRNSRRLSEAQKLHLTNALERLISPATPNRNDQ